MKHNIIFGLFALLTVLAAGCNDISISKRSISPSTELTNYQLKVQTITTESMNILSDYLLYDKLDTNPDEVILKLEDLYASENDPAFFNVLAECCLYLAKNSSDEDEAAKYFLSSAIYSYFYLQKFDNPKNNPYSAQRVITLSHYDQAVNHLMSYFIKNNLNFKYAFQMVLANGRTVNFTAPVYKLPISPMDISGVELCSAYEVKNLTHQSKSFGIGAPVIISINSQKTDLLKKFADNQAIPATVTFDFTETAGKRFDANLTYWDVRTYSKTKLGDHTIPLQTDFTTPLVYMIKDPMPMSELYYMINPDQSTNMEGLYLFEPFDENRIPVVVVHGLFSSVRTWIQMINTLQNDPELRDRYQFWGYSYSSGNPVIYSAKQFRDDLEAMHQSILSSGKSDKKFSDMILVCHSMGGLISKPLITDCDETLLTKKISPRFESFFKDASKEEIEFITPYIIFSHQKYIKRVIFIAVPHRGSDFALGAIAALGINLISLPQDVVQHQDPVMQYLHPGQKSKIRNGIENLEPSSFSNHVLDQLAIKVPYHSIIGNKAAANTPGGTDGIVPYWSSHLDGAQSELVVQSGHSAQQNPLAIQEVRRILKLHLQEVEQTTPSKDAK